MNKLLDIKYELARDFRNAPNPREQVKIFHDLYLATDSEIKEALEAAGIICEDSWFTRHPRGGLNVNEPYYPKLREARKATGLKLGEFAKRIDRSTQWVLNLEAGKVQRTVVPDLYLEILKEATGLSEDELYYHEPDGNELLDEIVEKLQEEEKKAEEFADALTEAPDEIGEVFKYLADMQKLREELIAQYVQTTEKLTALRDMIDKILGGEK